MAISEEEKDETKIIKSSWSLSGDTSGSGDYIEIDYTLLLKKQNDLILEFKESVHDDSISIKKSIHDDSIVTHEKLDGVIKQLTESNIHYSNLVSEAKTANLLFEGMLKQLTRIADCICYGCPDAKFSLCEVTEKVLREDGIIE